MIPALVEAEKNSNNAMGNKRAERLDGLGA